MFSHLGIPFTASKKSSVISVHTFCSLSELFNGGRQFGVSGVVVCSDSCAVSSELSAGCLSTSLEAKLSVLPKGLRFSRNPHIKFFL